MFSLFYSLIKKRILDYIFRYLCNNPPPPPPQKKKKKKRQQRVFIKAQENDRDKNKADEKNVWQN